MSDATASWRSDPTGRHDHRYWDGSAWTDHVADAGVAATDPYDGDATPPVPDPASAPAEPGATSGSSEATETASAPDDAAGSPVEPAAAAGEASATPVDAAEVPLADGPVEPSTDPTAATSTWSDPTAPAAVVPGPGGPEASAPAPTDATAQLPTTEATDVPTTETPTTETPTTDVPTTETPTTDVPTTEMPTTEAAGLPVTGLPVSDTPLADAPVGAAPPVVPPVDGAAEHHAGGDRGGYGTRRLVVGVAIVAVLALVGAVVLLSSGGSGTSPADAIAAKIATRLRADDHLNAKDASCVAHEVVAKLGTQRLKGIDFGAKELAGLQPAFTGALGEAAITCRIDVSALGANGGSVTTPTSALGLPGLGGLGDISSYSQLLANIYKSTFGLSDAKASCLATSMTDAITKGKIPRTDASSSSFFGQFLDHCHISLDDLNHPSTSG